MQRGGGGVKRTVLTSDIICVIRRNGQTGLWNVCHNVLVRTCLCILSLLHCRITRTISATATLSCPIAQ